MVPNYGYAYGAFAPADNRPVPFVVQDDQDIALLVKYVGAQESGTVEVNASGDILFKDGVVGAEVADATVGLPTLNGTIDVSNAAADTLGEAVANINASVNWLAVIVDGVQSDLIGTTIKLLDQGPLQAKVPEGISLEWDTSLVFELSRLIAPVVMRTDIRVYEFANQGKVGAKVLTVDPRLPFGGTVGEFAIANAVSTYATGASVLTVLVSDPDGGNPLVVYSEAGGATTAAKKFDFQFFPFRSDFGKRLLVRLDNSTAMSVATLQGQGALKRVFA